MTFQRIYQTTTEADLRRCADCGMSMEETATLLKVSPRAMKECVSVLGIKFHGRYKQKQYAPKANNPFGLHA